MTYSILLLGANTTLGVQVAKCLARRAQEFDRVAALTPPTARERENEAKHAPEEVEVITGSLTDRNSYRGFDVLISTVEDDRSATQEDYIEAAIAGGVRHFYPAEYGPDLSRALVRDDPYFASILIVRKQLEIRTQHDDRLGYTYFMTGIQGQFVLEANLLGLSKDTKSAVHLGDSDVRVSITHRDDIAEAIVASLLPRHLERLDMKRHIRFTGSTLTTSALYDAMAYVVHHPIDVTYQPLKAESKLDKLLNASNDDVDSKYAAVRRSLGRGVFALEEPGSQEKDRGVVGSGDELMALLKPQAWTAMVHKHFTSKKDD